MKSVLVLVLLTLYCCSVVGVSEHSRLFRNLHRDPFEFTGANISSRLLKDEWITQKLDHFDDTNEATWQMRYFSNDEFYVQGGPFFIYLGGEWIISHWSIMGGHIYDMAKEMNGYLFYTEHRFYGQSRPLGDTSTPNLQYLHIDQALEDVAHFIREKKASIPGAQNSGVIIVGASYSATMATWFRQRYPDLVNGAWASSAPLFAKVDYYEFKEVVGWAMGEIGGQACYTRLKQAFDQMEAEIKSGNFTYIQKYFNLCTNVDLNNQLDVWHFFYEMTEKLTQLVQYHSKGDIEFVCAELNDASVINPVEAFGKWVQRKYDKPCFNSYQSYVDLYNNVEWNTESTFTSTRQWTFQTCNEYGWYPTSTSKAQPFGSSFPLELNIKYCSDLFNGTFSATIVEQKVQETNTKNRGFKPEITNVFSTHGEIDPWRPMGIQEDLNPDAPVVIIKGASHCRDLSSISPSDTDQMRETKLRVTSLVKKWLGIAK